MKKILLITAALGLCAGSAFSQGAVTFGNNASTLVTTNNGTSGSAVTATGVKVQMFYEPGSLPAPTAMLVNGVLTQGSWEAFQTSPVLAVGSPLAGRFSSSTAETTGSDVAANGSAWITVVGWSGGYASLSAALAADPAGLVVGESTIWSQTTGTPPPGASVVMDGAGEFTGLVLNPLTPVPEPSIMILSGLGAAAMLLYRRKK